MASRGENAPRGNGGRRRIRKLRLLALLAVLAVLATASFSFGLVRAVAGEIEYCDPARRQNLERNGFIFDSNAERPRVLAVLRGSESRVLVESKEIAPVMKQAIVAIEDRRFYEHRGVDLRGIARAAWEDIRHKRVVQGGSTITQQFVKNACVKNEKTIARKVREAAIAWQLERDRRWSKDRILTQYLNTIYFGNGAYGIQQAARTYFGHGALKLTLPEAALLAGIPADPSRFDPVNSPSEARRRRGVVLEEMRRQGYLTAAELETAKAAPLPRPEDVRLPGTQGPAPYFANYVKQQLVARYGAKRVFGGGLRVRTTIDLKLQGFAREAIQKWLTEDDGPQAALVAIRPDDGSIVAMFGGNNYRESQFNLAVQATRQPGSAFKPFVLAAALEQGIAPATTFESEPTTISLGDKLWSVANYEDSYLGEADLETATIHSDNTIYARLTQLVGPPTVARTAKRLGVHSPLNDHYSIALGAEEVNPLEMARAFATLANDGKRVDGSLFGNEPRAIAEVGNAPGPDANAPLPRPVVGETTARIVTSLLEQVVEEGTGKRAALERFPAAGKTGTTENYGDAWFVGYTPHLVAAVWVGYPETLKPMLEEFNGEAVSGSTFPALIWKAFMERALPHVGAVPQSFEPPLVPYASPKEVVLRDGRLALDNGYCRGTSRVLFFGTEGPRRVADCKPNEVEVPSVVGATLAQARARLTAQPLRAELIFKPALPGQRVNVVLDQIPKRGALSAFDIVKLVLAKPLHGTVPEVEGLEFGEAEEKLKQRKLKVVVTPSPYGRPGRVQAQEPPGGVAAAPGMEVRLVVAQD